MKPSASGRQKETHLPVVADVPPDAPPCCPCARHARGMFPTGDTPQGTCVSSPRGEAFLIYEKRGVLRASRALHGKDAPKLPLLARIRAAVGTPPCLATLGPGRIPQTQVRWSGTWCIPPGRTSGTERRQQGLRGCPWVAFGGRKRPAGWIRGGLMPWAHDPRMAPNGPTGPKGSLNEVTHMESQQTSAAKSPADVAGGIAGAGSERGEQGWGNSPMTLSQACDDVACGACRGAACSGAAAEPPLHGGAEGRLKAAEGSLETPPASGGGGRRPLPRSSCGLI